MNQFPLRAGWVRVEALERPLFLVFKRLFASEQDFPRIATVADKIYRIIY